MVFRYCTTLAILALYTVWAAGVYYLYALTYSGIFLAAVFTAVSFILLKKWLQCNDVGKTEQSAGNGKITAIVSLLFALVSAGNIFILYHARTAAAIISPWQAVPWYFFLTVTGATLLLIIIALRAQYISTPNRLLLAAYFFQLFSVAAIVYAVGFGFDPFIHQATERLIAAAGAVTPKPLYYLGQYGLIVTLHKLTFIPVAVIDTWFVPALAALLLPPAVLAAARTLNSRRPIFLTLLSLATVPFSLFTLTTPQNLSYLFALLAIVLSLVRNNALLVMLLALAALAVHPLTGIPVCLFAALYIYALRRTRYRRTVMLAAFGLMALAVPLALTAYNYLHPITTPAAATAAGAAAPPFTAPFFSGLESAVLNVSYLYGFNAAYLVMALILAGSAIAWRTRRYSMLPYGLSALAMVLSYAITTRVDTSYLIAYERAAFADRLLILAALFAVPFIILALEIFIRALLRRQERPVQFILVGTLTLVPTAALYHSYPRLDNYFNSRSYSTSAADVAAVQWIDTDGAGSDYAVLANQQVSAAALREFGFKRYYQTQFGKLFFYPIPTGDALYPYYLDMVYEKADTKTARKAAELMGVDTVYFVLNRYWWAFDKVRAEAAATADAVRALDNGTVVIFKYSGLTNKEEDLK